MFFTITPDWNCSEGPHGLHIDNIFVSTLLDLSATFNMVDHYPLDFPDFTAFLFSSLLSDGIFQIPCFGSKSSAS